MSSIWGGLAALGDVAVDLGTNMSKSALADKIEQQREARADERLKAKEAREEARKDMIVDDRKTDFINRDGALFKRTFNAKGKQLDEALASQDEITKRAQDKAIFDQNSRIKELAIAKGEFTNSTMQELHDLDMQKTRAQIGTENAQGGMYAAQAGYYNTRDRGGGRGGSGGGLAGAMDEDGGFSASEFTEGFIGTSTGKQLWEQYKETLTAEEFLSMVRGGVLEAKEQGRDSVQQIRSALRGLAAKKAEAAAAVVPTKRK